MDNDLIHPTALVDRHARIGNGVRIGPFAIIHADVEIGEGSQVGSHCEIGYPTPLAGGNPLVIGKESLVRSHSVIYAGSELGDHLTTGHHVTIREGTTAGNNLQVGTLGDIQGQCSFGDYVRLHSNVHIGQGAEIGSFVWIFPYTVLTNDPHPPSDTLLGVSVGDYAAIATMSVILPGVQVGRGALVAAHSSVNRDVEPDTVVAGSPARFICETKEIRLKDGSNAPAYPWRRHFHRGYPTQVVAQWMAEFPTSD
jgi:acetyltransferase-like isoleucine patch superfamily enzyme